MNSAHLLDEQDMPGNDGELHLGMGSLIGIFFGLALVCGVFMGFGYMMGHRTPAANTSAESLNQAPKAQAVAPKPPAEVSANPSSVIVPAQASNPSNHTSSQIQHPPSAENVTTAVTVSTSLAKTSAPALMSAPNQPAPSLQVTKPVAETGGSIIVQIAAVKSRPDADALAAAVKKDDFNATVRTEPQDKLFHVQVGPFKTRDEAKVMRQKLANAGYNAFIK